MRQHNSPRTNDDGAALRMWRVTRTVCALAVLAGSLTLAHDDSMPGEQQVPLHARDTMRAFADEHHHNQNLAAEATTACIGGLAGTYPCSNVDLMAFLPLAQIGGGNGNDVWGWTDPTTGREYAIMGLTNGTAFVDVTDPGNPVHLGNLPPPAGVAFSSWRDIKVYDDHALMGSEAMGSDLQVMDLAQLRNVSSPPVTFTETPFHYTDFSTSHNIVLNEQTGYAYAVGTNNSNCGQGLHFVNVSDPTNPQFAGCYGADGYTDDAQCVVYHGPDTDYQGQEVCFAYNENTLTIVDVSVKSAPVQISRTGYANTGYAHQGWLTEDHTYLLLDDELDERNVSTVTNTRTLIWDVRDLDSPVHIGDYAGTATSIDHNQYIKGSYAYQANYRSGLRILDISDIASGVLTEVGFFDIYPEDDNASFNGAWSVYPFFDSGTVIVSGIEQGLYVLRPNLGTPSTPPNATITNPPDSATDLTGTVTVQIDAPDAEDDDSSLTVEFNIDGGSWQATIYVVDHYEAPWDTTSVSDGSHTVNARAIDKGRREGLDSANVMVSNGTPILTVDSVSVSIVGGRGNRNTGEVVVTVLDDGGAALAGVSVDGTFDGDWSGQRNGLTDEFGRAVLETPPVKNLSFVQFCVDDAVKNGWAFDSEASTLCGDSAGGVTPLGSVSGRVTDAASGNEIAAADVTTDTGETSATDVNGHYTITDVPAGNRTVSVSAAGYESAAKAATVIEGDTVTVDFQLVVQDSGGGAGAVKGTVYANDGSKLHGALVEVLGGSSALTNRGGKYNIQNVDEGMRTVTTSLVGFQPQMLQVTVIANTTVTVDFTLDP